MSQVTVTINGRNHVVACDDGQEQHVTDLAQEVDARIAELASASGARIGDTVLLVRACLMLVDEAQDAQKELVRLAGAGEEAESHQAATLMALAQRIEGVAEKLAAA